METPQPTLPPLEEPPRRRKGSSHHPAIIITVYNWFLPILMLIIFIIGIIIGYLAHPSSPSPTAKLPITPTADEVSLSPEQRQQLVAFLSKETKHFLGDENAPVRMFEFSDFQWPFCGRFAADAWRQIYENYVKTGKVYFGYVHFAFLGPESGWAAEASECAADQGKFWEYHDAIFNNQSGENRGAFSKDNLKKFAGSIGLDQKNFDECLDSGKYTEFIQQQTSVSRQVGISSTPSFVINGQVVLGAQPFQVFQQISEGELKK